MSDFLWSVVSPLLIVPLIIVVTIPYSLIADMKKQRSERLLPLAETDPDCSILHRLCAPFFPWLTSHGFQWVGFYRTPMTVLIAAWRQADRNVFFAAYVVQGKLYYDFVTRFDGNIGLTTGMTQNGQLFPKWPGSYVQSFTPHEIDSQWQRHEEASRLLADGGARPAATRVELESDFNQSMQVQLDWVQSIPVWPVRGIYWYFVRRPARHNKSVAEQLRRGWTRLPRDLTPAELARLAALWDRARSVPPPLA